MSELGHGFAGGKNNSDQSKLSDDASRQPPGERRRKGDNRARGGGVVSAASARKISGRTIARARIMLSCSVKCPCFLVRAAIGLGEPGNRVA